jgi:hypothetical protein
MRSVYVKPTELQKSKYARLYSDSGFGDMINSNKWLSDGIRGADLLDVVETAATAALRVSMFISVRSDEIGRADNELSVVDAELYAQGCGLLASFGKHYQKISRKFSGLTGDRVAKVKRVLSLLGIG